jgi:hypothetical protein
MNRPRWSLDDVLLVVMVVAVLAFCVVFGWRLVKQLAAAE